MTERAVYEVVEKTYNLVGHWFCQDQKRCDEMIIRRTFYTSLGEAKRDVLSWANENGGTLKERGWGAKLITDLDYKYDLREREVKEIDIEKHNVNVFFYKKAKAV